MRTRRSLSRRLTVFYTAIGGATLSTAGIAVVFGTFAVLTRPRAMMFAQAAHDVTIAAGTASADEETHALLQRILRSERKQFIRLVAIPAETMLPGPLTPPPGEVSIAALFGLGRRFIPIRDSGILVILDRDESEAIVRAFLAIVCAVGAGAHVLSWLVARVLTRKALAPLLTVTDELRRFADDDFSERQLAITDTTELGDLADAYNGAARQVTEAFLERARVEEQIRAFVAEAGHQLRTPLTVVAGYVDGLRRAGGENEEFKLTAFASLAVELRRMRALVERLMTLARLDSRAAPVRELVDIGAIVHQAVNSLAMTTDVPIQLHKNAESYVLGEPGDVYEAVANLLENAIKYGEGSPIVVRVESVAADVRVRVADGGPGIPERDRLRIFERFFRGERSDSVPGSGLGLPIALRAAQRLGGRLILEDARKGSTTFALHMPAFSDTSYKGLKQPRLRDELRPL